MTRDVEYEMHEAAKSGNSAKVEELLNHGADVNSQVFDGDTPLHNAARNGDDRLVKLLLDKGADVNARNWHDATPLYYATHYGHDSTAAFLLAQPDIDANAQALGGFSALHNAAARGLKNIVKTLIDRGVDVNATTIGGIDVDTAMDNAKTTPWHYAKHNGHEEVAKMLEEAMRKSPRNGNSTLTSTMVAKYGKRGDIGRE